MPHIKGVRAIRRAIPGASESFRFSSVSRCNMPLPPQWKPILGSDRLQMSISCFCYGSVSPSTHLSRPANSAMSAAHSDRIGKYWGVPDLAVEIVSESTGNKDRETNEDRGSVLPPGG